MNEWVARAVFLIGGIIVFNFGKISLKISALIGIANTPSLENFISLCGFIIMITPILTIKPSNSNQVL